MLKSALGMIVAVGLASSPAAAQMQPSGQMNSTMNHSKMMHHSMKMHGHMTKAQMMRWCHSMSHKKMMMNSKCRGMMRMHHATMHKM